MSNNPYIDAEAARLQQRLAQEMGGVDLEAPSAEADMDAAHKAAVDPVGAAMGEHGRPSPIVDAQGQPTGPAKHYTLNCEPGSYFGEGHPINEAPQAAQGAVTSEPTPSTLVVEDAATQIPALAADAVAVCRLIKSNEGDDLLDYTVHTPPGPPDMTNQAVFFLHWIGKHMDELLEHAKRERLSIAAAQVAVSPIPAKTGEAQGIVKPGPLKLISGDGKSLLSGDGPAISTDTKLH